MKKKVLLSFVLLCISIFMFGAISVSAETYGDLSYTVSNNEITITDCNESATTVEIPATIDGMPVTKISAGAFHKCGSLTSITIPDSVTSIGSNAFQWCTNLESLYITDLTAYLNCEYGSSLSNPMYYAKKLYINGKRATNIIIPEGIKKIPYCAFCGCDSLTSITIPDSVTSISNDAFRGCTGLTNITIPNSVTSIGSDVFRYCTGLTNINIPNSVTSIGSMAFCECKNLTDITIPNSVTSIEDNTFSGCINLESVTIPDSVTSIGSYAFSNCNKLTDITIPNSVNVIGDHAFQDCNSLTNIIIPDSIKTINQATFNGCSKLTSITIPNSVTSICSYAFQSCTALTDIILPDSITNIGDYAFYGCKGLTSITIPNSVASIGEKTFYGCSKLVDITISDSVSDIDTAAFSDCPIAIVFYTGTQDKWNEIYIASGNNELKQAEIVYNAAKKTYSFVTNCESTLPDITDYAVMASPTLSVDGKTLSGWYDNEGLTGPPVTFPYHGNATTLYAAWTDKTGASFDDAFEAFSNKQYTVTITDSSQLVYYEFTPKLTGEYRFYTKGNIDTFGYLYNSSQQQLTSNNNSGENSNFKITYNLTAGETYYIAVKCYSGTGTFTFVTETDCVESTKTVCVTASNGEKIFVTIPSYLPEDAQIILACYENGKLTQTLSSLNKNETIYFVVSKEFDSAKVMVWDNLENMQPICNAEIVK